MRKKKKKRKIRRRAYNPGRQIMNLGLGTAGAMIGLSVAGAVNERFAWKKD